MQFSSLLPSLPGRASEPFAQLTAALNCYTLKVPLAPVCLCFCC